MVYSDWPFNYWDDMNCMMYNTDIRMLYVYAKHKINKLWKCKNKNKINRRIIRICVLKNINLKIKNKSKDSLLLNLLFRCIVFFFLISFPFKLHQLSWNNITGSDRHYNVSFLERVLRKTVVFFLVYASNIKLSRCD